VINPDKRFRVEGSHWVSPVNFEPEVLDQFDFPTPLTLIDSTLRKARYTAGATTSADGFLRIAAALDAAGVHDESLNVNWFGEKEPVAAEFDLARLILAGGFGFTTNVYADTLLSNGATSHAISPFTTVDLLQGIGAKVIAPGIVPPPSAEAESRQLDELAQVLAYATSCGLDYTVTFAQSARRDFATMMRAANVAVTLGVKRIDLMDSTSSLNPEAMKVFIRRFRSSLIEPVPITMHAHDDFGLATASAIAAATVGASPDVSVNGVSYRCGFAALEEVVTSLEVLYGVDTGIALDQLQTLSEVVAREMGVPVPPLKPITGEYAFLKHTPGDVLACLRDGVDSFPPISGCVQADVVGAKVHWVWDTLSSKAMARQLSVTMGLDLDESQIDTLYRMLDDTVRSIADYPRWLERDQVESIAREVVANT
jgi:isopropylmalate/homocitrate/citramalate synthase